MPAAVNYFISFIILLFCVSLTPSTSIIRHKRIIGGTNASIQERWAFAPSLKVIVEGDDEFGQCGATVISKRHLLTAAHCVINLVNLDKSREVKHVRRGDFFLADMRLINDIHDKSFKSYNVSKRAYVHADYNFDKLTNDIAIIEYPIGFDFGVEPIRLASDFVENEGEMAFAVGYGIYQLNETGPLVHSYNLREGVFAFREPDYCRLTWTRPNMKQKICSGEYGRGTSLGDSGGPLMKNGDDGKWYQVGICSYGRRNSMFDKKVYPGISTRISYYCPWIKNVTNGEAECVPYERSSKENVEEELLIEKLVWEGDLNDAHFTKINTFIFISTTFTMLFYSLF